MQNFARKHQLLAVLSATSTSQLAPCGHCGSQNRYEMRFVVRVGDQNIHGCCKASLALTPDVDPNRIMLCAPSFLQD